MTKPLQQTSTSHFTGVIMVVAETYFPEVMANTLSGDRQEE